MSRHTPGMRRWLLTIEEENKIKTQPEALQLADDRPTSLNDNLYQWAIDAEDKLRRLHEAHEWQYTMAGQRLRRIEKLEASNTELLAALKEAHACILGDHWGNALDVLAYAINKAERTTT